MRQPAIAKLKVHRRTFLPNFLKRIRVGKTVTQLTIPTSAVTTVGFKPVEPRIELE
jgi:hypothetical protein